jgi:hypothetical protein
MPRLRSATSIPKYPLKLLKMPWPYPKSRVTCTDAKPHSHASQIYAPKTTSNLMRMPNAGRLSPVHSHGYAPATCGGPTATWNLLTRCWARSGVDSLHAQAAPCPQQPETLASSTRLLLGIDTSCKAPSWVELGLSRWIGAMVYVLACMSWAPRRWGHQSALAACTSAVPWDPCWQSSYPPMALHHWQQLLAGGVCVFKGCVVTRYDSVCNHQRPPGQSSEHSHDHPHVQ